MNDKGFFPMEPGRFPGWAYVLFAGVLVAGYIVTEEIRPGTLSGEHCRDVDGVFVPVQQCTKKRRRRRRA